jgi:hypothetical protein
MEERQMAARRVVKARTGGGVLQSLAVTLAVVGFGFAWAAVERRVVARDSEHPPARIEAWSQEWELALEGPIAEDVDDRPPQRRMRPGDDHSQPRPSRELLRPGANPDECGS